MTLQYPTLPFPRERDTLLLSIFMSHNPLGIDFTSWNRCRLFLRALFLSDITTVDGTTIDKLMLSQPPDNFQPMSSYDFPEEQPSEHDWAEWARFWQAYTYDNDTLPSKLGSWINPSHSIWRWHFHAASKTLLCRIPGGAHTYRPRSGLSQLRSAQIYEYF